MRQLLALISSLALLYASSTAVAIENHLETFNKEVNDSLKTKINTLRNILLQLDFKHTDDAKKALLKMDEFNKASEAGVSVRLENLTKGLKDLIKKVHGRGSPARSSLSTARRVSRTAAAPTTRKPIRRATGPLPRASSQLRTRRSAAYYDDSEEDSDDLYYDSDADMERYDDEESLERSFYRYARDRHPRRQ